MRLLLTLLSIVCMIGAVINAWRGNPFATFALLAAAISWALLLRDTSKDVNR